MRFVQDVIARADAFNKKIKAFNDWRRERVKEIEAKATELRKEAKGFENEVIMRLDYIETVEKAWVSKHPLATFIGVLIWTGLILWAGIAIGHHGCKVVP